MRSRSRIADDHVRPLNDEERQLYKLLSTVTQRPASSLIARWREPSLTVHNIEVSGPKSDSPPTVYLVLRADD